LRDASPSLQVRGAASDELPQRAFAVPGDVAADGVPDEIARRTAST
jgi:hypothetical protein